MAGTRNAASIARRLLIALAILLVAGVAGSVWTGIRAKSSASTAVVTQAQTIADKSLSLIFHPNDLAVPATGDRATVLETSVTTSVLDTTPFTVVTLWSKDGRILFSTDSGRIGNTLPGERDRIKSAIDGAAQTDDVDGALSVMVPFQLPSGVGSTVAIEMTRSDQPIIAAEAPWRTNTLFLLVLLGVVGFLLTRVRRLGDSLATSLSFAGGRPTGAMATPPPLLPMAQQRSLGTPTPGLREEAEARRRADDRAKDAEERLSVLQEQYRKTLEDLQATRNMIREFPAPGVPDPRVEERALRAEGRVRTLEGQVQALHDEREKLAREMVETASAARVPDLEHLERLQQAEQDVIGLRAELEGAQTQLSIAQRELEGSRLQATRTEELQEDLDAAHVEALHAREAAETAQSELSSAATELDDARSELRALRNEEQRAAMLEDELRSARANLESMTEAHRVELIERETDLEEKVRAVREEFQAEVASVETSYREQLGERESVLADRIVAAEQQSRGTAEELASSKVALEAASEEAATAREQLAREAERHAATAAEFEAMKSELADRQGRFDQAGDEVKRAEAHVDSLSTKLDKTREELAIVREQFTAQMARADELSTALSHADREAQEATRRAGDLAAQLGDAAQSNTEVNRRLQELEARRALEIADGQGRADLDELLRVTQERLAGQTEKLIHAEGRVHELEREVAATAERTEEIEAELRQQHMAEAIRQIRGEGHEQQPHVVPDGGANGYVDGPLEDRRAGTSFRTELSRDARKSLSQILGLAQILKHQKDAKEQGHLIKQLTSYARRLDHTVSDLVDADQLARGTVELNVKRTDLQALVMRVVEESGIAADHEVRIDAEPLLVGIDQRRTEQILSGLLRSSGDRTPRGKSITIKMAHVDGGAMLFVEDPEPSSDASMSPVVRRFAEVQGGWARVESREGGGSSFRVFLPDGGPNATPSDVDEEGTDAGNIDVEDMADPPVVVDEPWDPNAEQILIQELHRLSELNADD